MEYIIYTIVLLLFMVRDAKEQRLAFALLLILSLIKWDLSWHISSIDVKEYRFYLNNSLRIFQHTIIVIVINKYIYKDHRGIIPIIVNVIIVIMYAISNISIYYDNWSVQKYLFANKYFFGSLIMLSLVDYGEKIYDRIYGRLSRTNNKYISRMFKYLYTKGYVQKNYKGKGT